jgi:hypothetical protein
VFLAEETMRPRFHRRLAEGTLNLTVNTGFE